MRVLPVRRGCPGLLVPGSKIFYVDDGSPACLPRFQETRRADVHNAARPRNARFVALGNIMFPRLCALLLSLAAISAPAYSALDVDISVAAKTAMRMGSGHECCLFSEGAVASDGKVVMAPFMGGEIGVFDPSDDTLTYFSAGDAGSGIHTARDANSPLRSQTTDA